MTSSVLAATILYYTPYRGNQIALYSGSAWTLNTFPELSLTLGGLSASTNYDVFMFLNAGVPTLELTAWTNDTTRATALVRQDGVWSRTGALTRRYLGSFRTTTTIGQTEFRPITAPAVGCTAANILLWNNDNRAPVAASIAESTSSWTYATLNTWRAANNSATARIFVVVGLKEDAVEAIYSSNTNNNASTSVSGVGVNTVTAFSGSTNQVFTTGASQSPAIGRYEGALDVGYNFVAPIELCAFGTPGWFGTRESGAAQTAFTYRGNY